MQTTETTATKKTTTNSYQRKEFRRPIMEILDDLAQPIPTRFIKYKTLGGNRIEYVPWSNLVRLLEYFAPGFDWEVRTHFMAERTVVEGRLTIRAAEGDFVRESTGTEDNNCSNFGDPISNSEAKAFRRCCSKFGLGLHLLS